MNDFFVLLQVSLSKQRDHAYTEAACVTWVTIHTCYYHSDISFILGILYYRLNDVYYARTLTVARYRTRGVSTAVFRVTFIYCQLTIRSISAPISTYCPAIHCRESNSFNYVELCICEETGSSEENAEKQINSEHSRLYTMLVTDEFAIHIANWWFILRLHLSYD